MTYDEGVLRSLSPGFNAMGYLPEYMLQDLGEFIRAAQEVDRSKRLYFYTERNDDLPNEFSCVGTLALHAVMGVVTEAGELAENLLKAIRNREDLDRTNLIEELGDLEWYMSLLRHARQLTQGEVQQANLAKLKARYPKRFTEEYALNRNLTQEIEAMENTPPSDTPLSTPLTAPAIMAEVQREEAFSQPYDNPSPLALEEEAAMRVLGLNKAEFARLRDYLKMPAQNWPVDLQSFVRDFRLRNEGVSGITLEVMISAFIKNDPNNPT